MPTRAPNDSQAWLIGRLSQAQAFPDAEQVEIRQTHISIVALVGAFVYKVRKTLNLGFLDFTTLEKRRLDCHDEVRLNRRLAPDVYLDVVPIVRQGDEVRVEGRGEPIEWAVKMRRLPDEASLLAQLERGSLSAEVLRVVAERIAAFHRATGRNAGAHGGFDEVVANVRDNFEALACDALGTSPAFSAARAKSEQGIEQMRALSTGRAAHTFCDGHGDLRLEHVYTFARASEPPEVCVIDCVEFSDRIRFGDPVSDIAFLVMDLVARGAAPLANAFSDAYFASSGDTEGAALLPFYIAYRSMVRAKVRAIEAREPEVSEEQRNAARDKAHAHLLLALGTLSCPFEKPALVLVGGLPGTGKSTLSRNLARCANFVVLRSDVVRKELAHVSMDESSTHAWADGIYSEAWTRRTYQECLRRADEALRAGGRVIVDATFARERDRHEFAALAHALSVEMVGIECHTDQALVRERLAQRTGDASDADFAIYERARVSWESAAPRSWVEVDTNAGIEAATRRALDVLRDRELAE